MKKQINDFTKAMLPHNRKQVFFDILKNRSNVLIRLGLILLLFALPLIIINVGYNILFTYIRSLSLTDEEMFLQLITILNLKNILYIFASIIFAIGLSGVYQILRCLIWGNNIMFKSDFKKGIKSNFLHFSITLILITLFNLIFQNLLFMKTNITSVYYKIAIIVSLILAIIIIPCSIIVLSHTTIYKLPYIYRLKNSILITLLKFYIVIPLGILSGALLFVQYIPLDIAYYFSLVFLPLISPVIIMFNMLICDYLFDLYINKDNYPTIFRKGMSDNE